MNNRHAELISTSVRCTPTVAENSGCVGACVYVFQGSVPGSGLSIGLRQHHFTSFVNRKRRKVIEQKTIEKNMEEQK